MKKARNATWFILGVLVTVMVSQLALPAVATLAGKTIDVFTGVNIYVDDEKLNPTDANGNAVEVFVYNGTTYLPVRAVSDALDVPVQWDGKTSSVYLGKHSSEKMAVLLANLDYFTGKSLSLKNLKDNLGNEHPQSLNTNFNNTYLLNGQYSAISGTLFQVYEYRSKYIETTLNIYGDGELLYTATVTQGVQPIDFKVDLTGVLELRLELAGNSVMYDAGALADLGLWT